MMLLLAACSQSEAPPALVEPPPEPPAPEPEAAPAADEPAAPATPVAELMRGHFARATMARMALIRADMPAAKEAMAWLATHELGGALPAELKPRLGEMQTAAAAFKDAANLREAGVAFATTLSKCGSCHAAAGKGPTIAAEPMPDTPGLTGHMQRHHWATRRMWSGLVTASDEAFGHGVDALDEAPLDAAALSAVGDQVDKVGALDAHVHNLAKKMKAAETQPEKIEAYGHMLATCAVCHRLMGRGPAPVGPTE